MSNTIFYGRIIKDIECKYSETGKAFTKFGIAVNRKFSTSDKKTDFFNIVAFNKKAEILSKYFQKGNRIVIYCHPQQEEYTNQNGQKINTVSFILDDFDFVDAKSENNNMQNHEENRDIPPTFMRYDFMNIPDDAEELPFS